MGVVKSPDIQAKLIEHGRAETTPVAIVENGTRKNQRVFTTTLEQMASEIEAQHVQSPALLIIGEVAALHQELAWFGKTEQVSSFAQPITKVGQTDFRVA